MYLLGIDIGTTHCKAGLFAGDDVPVKIASRPTVTHKTVRGEAYFDPEELWKTVLAALKSVLAPGSKVTAIGIASMAESGLLVDRRSGRPASHFLPWFDTAARPQAEKLRQASDPLERYLRSGIAASFKCSLAKILWLRENQQGPTEDTVWLSAADYIAYRLCGSFGTDHSLAGRTFAFRVDQKQWDAEWLEQWELSPGLFPPAFPSGTPLGNLLPALAAELGLEGETPVAVSGHDHICAALGAGVVEPGKVFDSMGTAETLLGVLPERPLTEADYSTGLHYGCHVARGKGYWLGGLSASGGSVEWFRSQILGESTTYAEIDALLQPGRPGPTGILYYPYLLGGGTLVPDPQARAAFIGLTAAHNRSDLLKAMLEGTAYEVESLRRAGEKLTGSPIPTLLVAGGGARNTAWQQIKADISGCRIEACTEPEATLLGAALVAGIGCGIFTSEAEALSSLKPVKTAVYLPDEENHAIYKQLYENGYLSLQQSLLACDDRNPLNFNKVNTESVNQ